MAEPGKKPIWPFAEGKAMMFILDWAGIRLYYTCLACGRKSPTYQSHLLHKKASYH
jgi:hypothetical protein